jgi:hypothetical protein
MALCLEDAEGHKGKTFTKVVFKFTRQIRLATEVS